MWISQRHGYPPSSIRRMLKPEGSGSLSSWRQSVLTANPRNDLSSASSQADCLIASFPRISPRERPAGPSGGSQATKDSIAIGYGGHRREGMITGRSHDDLPYHRVTASLQFDLAP